MPPENPPPAYSNGPTLCVLRTSSGRSRPPKNGLAGLALSRNVRTDAANPEPMTGKLPPKAMNVPQPAPVPAASVNEAVDVATANEPLFKGTAAAKSASEKVIPMGVTLTMPLPKGPLPLPPPTCKALPGSPPPQLAMLLPIVGKNEFDTSPALFRMSTRPLTLFGI